MKTGLIAALFALAFTAFAAEDPKLSVRLPSKAENEAFFKLFHQRLAGPEPAKTAPRLTFDREEKLDGYTFFTVSYNVEEDERVSGYLLVPDHEKGQKLPLMFCLHPTTRIGKNGPVNRYPVPPADEAERRKRENRAYALDLVKRGFVCFVPDRGGYGERTPLTDEQDCFRTMADYQTQLQKRHPGWTYARGKVPFDLSRALDGLLELDWIDGENVGTVGHSLGGWDSIHFWGTDSRVKAAVINSGGAYRVTPELWFDQSWREKFLAGEKMGMDSILSSAQVYIMLAAPRPLLYMRGFRETPKDGPGFIMDNSAVVDAYYRALPPGKFDIAGKPQFATLFHGDGHDFPPFAREAAWRWLERQLMGKY